VIHSIGNQWPRFMRCPLAMAIRCNTWTVAVLASLDAYG
jgi:hypothetical protein